MNECIVKYIFDYIENTELEVLEERLGESVLDYQKHGYISYAACWIEYFYRRRDYKRLIYNVFVKRIKQKPFMEEFFRKMPPAFYTSAGMEPTFCQSLIDLKDNVDSFRALEFVDRKSYYVLLTILTFRMTGIKEVLFKWIDDKEKMYFDEDIIPYFRKDWDKCFVDCGAYNGDSIRAFVKKSKSKDSIFFAFEPLEDNFMDLENQVKQMGLKIKIFNGAVSSRKGSVQMSGKRMGGANYQICWGKRRRCAVLYDR